MAGACILLEHINLNIPYKNRLSALEFYTKTLGCSVNPISNEPGRTFIHVNSGLCQFHLPHSSLHGGRETAQVWDGIMVIGVSEKNVDEEVIIGPFQNNFKFKSVPNWDPFVYGGHNGEQSHSIGIIEAIHWCDRGVSHRIAIFFRTMFGAEIELRKNSSVVFFGGRRKNGAGEKIINLQKQSLIFQEIDNAPPRNSYDLYHEKKGYHICFYIDDLDVYTSAYERCHDLGTTYINPRFEGKEKKASGSAHCLAEALEYHQFRIKNIVDVETRELLLCLEQEVRFVKHPSCPLKKINFIEKRSKL